MAGDLHISSDYPGSLNILTITNITGSVYIAASEITNIALGNLFYLDQFYMFSSSYILTSLSVTQLSKINDLSISSELPMSINDPTLASATDIRLTEKFSSTHFPNLVNANISLNTAAFHSDYFTPVDLSFPSLVIPNMIELCRDILRYLLIPPLVTPTLIATVSTCPALAS